MSKSTETATPAHIEEFNQIAGLIFAQLFERFPVVADIDRDAIGKGMGIGQDWSGHVLPSGRIFGQVFGYTLAWLVNEDYVRASGAHPAERAILATKGLHAMNARPSGLTQ